MTQTQKPAGLIQQIPLPVLAQRELERMILSGELSAGTKLNEAALAEMLGISRGPLREAFRSLEESGLVRQEKNIGVYVREISVAEADEIYEVREALEALVGRRLATSITSQQIKELRTMLDKMDKLADRGNVDGYYLMNLEFHDTLVRMTCNGKLLLTYRRLIKELNLFRRNSLGQQGNIPASTREHREIVDHIANGDADGAAQAMLAHVQESRARVHRSVAHGK